MCGSTGAQDQLQQEQIQAYQQAQQMTAKQYENQQAIYGPMAAQFKSILAKGPNAEGFSPEETQALNANVVENTAENYSHAATAVNEQLAARGGGDNPLVSGEEAALKETLAASAAGEQSSEESQVKQASFKAGADQWRAAAGGLEDIAAGQNPVGFENAETGSGSAASTTANDIATQSNSWINAAIGAAGTVAGGFAGRPPCYIAAELWGGWNEPRTVKVRTWMMTRFVHTRAGRVIVPFYARHGEAVARAIRRWPAMRVAFIPLFDWALRKAEKN